MCTYNHVLCAKLLCILVLIFCTVLLELYEEELVTEDEVKEMTSGGGDLLTQLISFQHTKPPEVITKTADVLDKFGHNDSARKLRGQ